MIIDRYIAREITLTWFGAAIVLLLIFSGQQTVHLLDLVISGRLDGALVGELMGLTILRNLVVLLPFALYLAILLTIGRLYRDSEMAAMGACGVGEPHLARIIGFYALVVTLVSLVWALWGGPWAEGAFEQTWDEASEITGVSGLTPGRFNEFRMEGGQAVIFAEDVDAQSGELRGTFIRVPASEGRGEDVVVADRGRQVRDLGSGRRYLLLEDGHRYEGEPGAADFRIIAFEMYRVHMADAEPAEIRKLRSRPTAELLASDDPEWQAELHWRLAIPLSTLPLALLAIPLSRSSPRQGRFGRLFVALLVFILYSNLMGLARTWVDDGIVPAAVGIWWVHGLVLALALGMFRSGQRLKRPRRGRRGEKAA